MAKILNLETATTNCSVCISEGKNILSLKENNAIEYSHSEQLHPFIKEVVDEAGITFADLDAIAVSKGPGSYTGLRIGVSAAKGLCFALDKPLVSVPTLESMAHQVRADDGEVIIPVLDARRMEVYSAVYDSSYAIMRATDAEIIDENSFSEYASKPKVFVVGSGAKKCKETLTHSNFYFDTALVPSAKQMAEISHKKFQAKEFEDVAYFEPFYLKDFVLQGKRKP